MRYRPVVEYLCQGYAVSERRACRLTRLHRGTYHYPGNKNPSLALRMKMREIAQPRVRYGYRKIRVLLNREGWKVLKYLNCEALLLELDEPEAQGVFGEN